MPKCAALYFVVMIVAAANAQTVNLQGIVANTAGQPIKGAVVTLVRQGLSDTTGTDGRYSFEKTFVAAMSEIVPQTEQISLSSGVLRFAVRNTSPVTIEMFDVKGTLIQKAEISNVSAGTYSFNVAEHFRSTNLFVIKASIGNQTRSFSYMTLGSNRYSINASRISTDETGGALAKTTSVLDTLRVVADGYKTLDVVITSYDNQVQNCTLEVIGNGSTGSIGCGKDLSDLKSGTYKITSAGLNREYIINIPANYDKNKPYRLIFGMHCFGSNMQGVANDKYYQLKRFADSTKTDCIFVAPNGIVTNGNAMWDQNEKDHTFFDDMLKLFKEKLCVDTTRVFSCGFSYGAMFTNSLSLSHQKVLRAVACYAPANWNIYLPENTHEPIAYMSTTGISDPSCKYIFDAAKRQGGKYCVLIRAEDNGCTIPENENIPTAAAGSRSHIVYEFKGCKEGYPVKFFSFDGAHQAGPMDNISGDDSKRSWIPVETWKFFMQF